ncbi:Wadjet anti-phage system protein JetD domain-containing protein [Tatumella morbirosei]|uniref:Wadjet anti-phage system protein JetD domain-containing protein n=1 Tax=Tatumella morbirosei TaxID=642227 RepID=UPI002480CC33|nr:Wadjet anti-phage system protein JetD domain-containing protein [Tatumella morbirosei]
MPVSRVLVIEDEHCLHQLPALLNTIAILGCDLDAQWLSSSVLDENTLLIGAIWIARGL